MRATRLGAGGRSPARRRVPFEPADGSNPRSSRLRKALNCLPFSPTARVWLPLLSRATPLPLNL